MLAELVRLHRATAIIVSHDPAAASETDRAVQIRDGRLVEDTGPDGNGSLVLGRGGWVRLPAELLAEAGIERRVRVTCADGGLLVSAVPHSERRPPAAIPAARTRVNPVKLETRELTRGYRQRRVLNDLSATFAAGTFTVVTGRSGSGKTTLLRLLCGLDLPDRGEVLLDSTPFGRDPEQLANIRRTWVGYLAQEPAPLPFLTATENIELALAVRGCEREEGARRAATALADVDLAERGRQRVARLSAGERQRVGLARALACANGLLILDEPTSR